MFIICALKLAQNIDILRLEICQLLLSIISSDFPQLAFTGPDCKSEQKSVHMTSCKVFQPFRRFFNFLFEGFS